MIRPLNTRELLDVWENGLALPLIERSAELLCVATDRDRNFVNNLSIGQRDVRLLIMREWLFGSRLVNNAICPQCGQKVEWESEVQDLRIQQVVEETNKRFFLMENEFSLCYRLPNSDDVMHVLRQKSVNPESDLLERCLLEITKDGVNYNVSDLPDDVITAINADMNKQDPQADISLLLHCAACAAQWRSVFDISSYIWTEINAWALHLLEDIYVLARAFGWAENDILNMSARRRQLYLEMIRA